MRLILCISIIFLFVQISYGQKPVAAVKNSLDTKIETVDFCDLLKEPNIYQEKIVRTVAVLAYGGEDFIVLYCPNCYKSGIIKPIFTDYFREHTQGTYIGRLPRLKHSSGTIKIILVGKLSKGKLLINSVEKAKYISREPYFPDRLSPKVQYKANCTEN